MEVLVDHEPDSVRVEGGRKVLVCRDRSSKAVREVSAQDILVTTGVQSNADWLRPRPPASPWTGTPASAERQSETNVPGVFAIGDLISRRTMFRHTANYHSELVWYNKRRGRKGWRSRDEHAVPARGVQLPGGGQRRPPPRSSAHGRG